MAAAIVYAAKEQFYVSFRAGLHWQMKKQFLPASPTSAAKAGVEHNPVIAALKRCATQKQAPRPEKLLLEERSLLQL
jgi:hypothetical protein